MPPQGAHWSIVKHSPEGIVFHRRLPGETNTLMAQASRAQATREVHSIDEVKNIALHRIGANPDPSRFETVDLAVNAVPSVGAWCARGDLKGLDRGAPQARGEALVFENHEIVCLHPNDRTKVFFISYSERRLPDEPRDANATSEAEEYLASVRFQSLP